MRAFVLAAALLAAPSAFAIEGTANIIGFSFPGAGGAQYSFVPSGEAKFWNGVAKTTAIVEAAGRTMRTEAAISRAAGAGRYVYAACAANVVVCAGGVAFAAYMMSGGFEQDDAKLTWGHRKGGPGQFEYYYSTNKTWYTSLSALCAQNGKDVTAGSVTHDYISTGSVSAASPGDQGICYFAYTRRSTGKVEGQAVGKFPARAGTEPLRFVPATQEELEEHFKKNEPNDDVANEAGAAGAAVPSTAPQIAPVRSPLGEPYKNAQGQTRQDAIECKQTSGAASPLSMTCTTMAIDPATDSPTKATPAPQPPASGASAPSGTAPPANEKPVDLCAANPDIVACAKFGSVPQSETLPKKITPVNFISEPLGLPDACPAPIAGPGGVSIPFDSACDAFRMLRPLVVAMAAVLSMLMVVGALRTS